MLINVCDGCVVFFFFLFNHFFFSDVVFFIFLYQKWIYRVDPTRVNEFGYAAEPIEEETKEIEDKKKDDKKND